MDNEKQLKEFYISGSGAVDNLKASFMQARSKEKNFFVDPTDCVELTSYTMGILHATLHALLMIRNKREIIVSINDFMNLYPNSQEEVVGMMQKILEVEE